MEFACAVCGKRHTEHGSLVDKFVRCACGTEYYVFSYRGLQVTIPAGEMKDEYVLRGFRNFVVSTGRCRDAGVERCVTLREALEITEPTVLMEAGLRRYQQGKYGNGRMNSGDVESILEIVNEGKDAVVKGQKEGVSVMEQRVKARTQPSADYRRMMEEQRPKTAGGGRIRMTGPPLRQWQLDIMEEDAARAGHLFGEAE